MHSNPALTEVYLEVGAKRVFACAPAWPGWCRSGRSEELALRALADYAPRFAPVVHLVGETFPFASDGATEGGVEAGIEAGIEIGGLTVMERVPGNATTDFGAPGAIPELDYRPVHGPDARREAAFVAAAWQYLDAVVAETPPELRKGPRGGGRDRDRIVDHVLGSDAGYARKIGVKHRQPEPTDTAAVAALRADILAVLSRSSDGTPLVLPKGWPARYAARRIAWHALDHAWEIEDRREPAG